MKDIDLDAEGNPVILVVTSNDHKPGPSGEPRIWTIAHWTGNQWTFYQVTGSTHNYDMGSLYIDSPEKSSNTDSPGLWRLVAPTEPGPQYWGTGGEMAIWISRNQGQHWEMEKQLTRGSHFNHTYARRPVNAHPDFYAFWADGNPDQFSESRLYFTDQTGDQVWVLPYEMNQEREEPIPFQP